MSLQGPQGPAGSDGNDGARGERGPAGSHGVCVCNCNSDLLLQKLTDFERRLEQYKDSKTKKWLAQRLQSEKCLIDIIFDYTLNTITVIPTTTNKVPQKICSSAKYYGPRSKKNSSKKRFSKKQSR